MCILYGVLTLPSHFTRRAVVIFNVFRCLGQFCHIVVVYYNFSCCSRFISDLSWRESTELAYTNLFTMLRLSVHLSHCTIVSECRKQLNLWNRSSPSGSMDGLEDSIYKAMVVGLWGQGLLACLFPSSLLRVGDHFMHQQSPLLPILRQPWTLCHWSVWPVLDIICPSLRRPASSSLPINSTFQYFGAQISDSDHMTKILKLTSLYSCRQLFLWLYFLQHMY